MLNFAIEVKNQTLYHIINMKRFGTYCKLPLNQELRIFADEPTGIDVCPVCQQKKGEEVSDEISQGADGKQGEN